MRTLLTIFIGLFCVLLTFGFLMLPLSIPFALWDVFRESRWKAIADGRD